MGINLLERRTVKASSSFSGKENAHYICLIKKFYVIKQSKNQEW